MLRLTPRKFLIQPSAWLRSLLVPKSHPRWMGTYDSFGKYWGNGVGSYGVETLPSVKMLTEFCTEAGVRRIERRWKRPSGSAKALFRLGPKS